MHPIAIAVSSSNSGETFYSKCDCAGLEVRSARAVVRLAGAVMKYVRTEHRFLSTENGPQQMPRSKVK